MSDAKLKEINGGVNLNSSNRAKISSLNVENANDLNVRKAALTPLEFRVTQQRETERPFSNKYNKHWEAGTYHCVVCDAELFRSETKFESKSGWPAFYNVVDPKRVKLTADLSHIGANLLLLVAKPDLARTEVSCSECNAHLGHLFKDGPKPTGLRYCINSSSLTFKSESEDSTDNNARPSSVSINGNGNGTMTVPIREFECNPENLCNRPATTANTPVTPTANTDFCGNGKTPREQFFSSIESNVGSLPPMGALCINNRSCQRVAPPQKKPSTENIIKPRPIVIPIGAENNINSSNKLFTSGASNGTTTTPTSNVVTKPVVSVTPKSRYPISKGASLTAARINFFQKISARQDSPSPSRWATTFNAKWSSDKSSSPPADNNTLETPNSSSSKTISSSSIGSNSPCRFPNSCSSGSLCTVLQQPKLDEISGQARRSTSSYFSNSPSHFSGYPSPVSVEQISSPPRPVALRETTL